MRKEEKTALWVYAGLVMAPFFWMGLMLIGGNFPYNDLALYISMLLVITYPLSRLADYVWKFRHQLINKITINEIDKMSEKESSYISNFALGVFVGAPIGVYFVSNILFH